MSKKNWVKVKRGLVDDPKHREAIGEAIWLYLHILDRTDFETGIAYDWKDAAAAETLEMPVDTLRKQRRRLERAGYITAEKKQHKQSITVNNWTNPRAYDGEIINRSGHQRQPSSKSQSDRQSDRERPVSTAQSDRQSDHSRPPTPIIPCIMNHEEELASGGAKKPPRPEDPLFVVFSDAFSQSYDVFYQHKNGDFVRLAELKRANGGILGDRWARAVENYFASVLPSHTLADLCQRFAVFQRSPVNQYGRPIHNGRSNTGELVSERKRSGATDPENDRRRFVTKPKTMF